MNSLSLSVCTGTVPAQIIQTTMEYIDAAAATCLDDRRKDIIHERGTRNNNSRKLNNTNSHLNTMREPNAPKTKRVNIFLEI